MSGLRPRHRARRLLGSLRPGRPPAPDLAWAHERLGPAQASLFERMSGPDQRHAIAVARTVERALPGADGWVVQAALLHDVGKSVAGLGTYGRVVATLSGRFADEATARSWQRGTGITRKVGLYLRYPQLGAELLEVAGADPRVVAWAREHHEPPERWSVPRDVGEALAAADG